MGDGVDDARELGRGADEVVDQLVDRFGRFARTRRSRERRPLGDSAVPLDHSVDPLDLGRQLFAARELVEGDRDFARPLSVAAERRAEKSPFLAAGSASRRRLEPLSWSGSCHRCRRYPQTCGPPLWLLLDFAGVATDSSFRQGSMAGGGCAGLRIERSGADAHGIVTESDWWHRSSHPPRIEKPF